MVSLSLTFNESELFIIPCAVTLPLLPSIENLPGPTSTVPDKLRFIFVALRARFGDTEVIESAEIFVLAMLLAVSTDCTVILSKRPSVAVTPTAVNAPVKILPVIPAKVSIKTTDILNPEPKVTGLFKSIVIVASWLSGPPRSTFSRE